MAMMIAHLLGGAALCAGASNYCYGSVVGSSNVLPEGVIEPFDYRASHPHPVNLQLGSKWNEKAIDAAVTSAMRQYGVVGCGVCVVRDSEIVYSRGFGYSELPNSPFEATTASRCGSLAKAITSLCALVLFDLGKLSLDAEILPILKASRNTAAACSGRPQLMGALPILK